MGILNVTPDSFYADSRVCSECAIVERVEQLLLEGVDIVDVGGCSTRPGSEPVEEEEEYIRLNTALAVLRRQFPELPVSIDTFRAGVVQRMYDSYGAFAVNDISAGDDDAAMITTIAKLHLPYIAMHKRGTPQTMQQLTDYDDVVGEVKKYLHDKIATLHAAGITNVIIDPGFGFAKTVEQNYALLRHLNEFTALGAPLLVGVSRKGMLWKPLEISPAEALCATSAINLQALLQGAKILRVHDVKEAKQMIKLAQFLTAPPAPQRGERYRESVTGA